MYKGILFFLSLFFLVPFAQGAKYPNAIELTFNLYGNAAQELADLFAVTKNNSEIAIELSENTAWAVYGLKDDLPTPLSNSDNQPSRSNVVRFTTASLPKLTIGPFWEDLATALPPSEQRGYRFSSQNIGTDLLGDDVLTRLLRKLKTKPEWQGQCVKEEFIAIFSKTFIDEHGSKLTLKVWCMDQYPRNKLTSMYSVELILEHVNEGE